MNYNDSIIGTATELNVLRENRVLDYHQSATVYPGRGQSEVGQESVKNCRSARNPRRGQCNAVWRSPVETGRGQCKGVPVASGEAPGENARYRTLFGDRTLVVVAKAQILG